MIVCHFCETSVSGSYFRAISEHLSLRDVRVLLLELGESNPPSWLAGSESAEYHALGVSGSFSYPLAVARLVAFLSRERVDILHTHLFNSGLIAAIAKYINRRPVYAYMRHHTDVVKMLGGKKYVLIDKWMAERADHLLAVSETARDYMRDIDKIRSPIDVVYLGFDFDRFAPNAGLRATIREEFGFADDDLVIGYVGNFAPGKGHVQLIEAYAEIVRTIPNARLLLLGRGKLTEVDDAIGRLGLGRRITFAGWREDTHACLNAMDIFVQPSLSEAFSQVLIEAMGVGLPAVATGVGSAREVIEDGISGLIVPPDDIGAIASAISDLAANPEHRDSIAETGQRFVRRNFTVQRMIDEQYELYRKWLGLLD